MKKDVGIIIIVIICIILIAGLIVLLANDENDEEMPQKNTYIENNNAEAPSKVYSNEKDVKDTKAFELFSFIPKVYTEEISPFTSRFMLDAVMNKILDTEEEQDFSVGFVDSMITKIFGKDSKIDKEEVSTPDVANSIFYYSKEANSYTVIPVGYEGIYRHQIFKNATETNDAYYVYTYVLIGGYSYDEDSIVQDEFGDIDYENAKVQVVVGDKDGNDLIHVFNNYTELYDETIWLEEYENIMPVFRYTLKKDGKNYYLIEVEQLNY